MVRAVKLRRTGECVSPWCDLLILRLTDLGMWRPCFARLIFWRVSRLIFLPLFHATLPCKPAAMMFTTRSFCALRH